MSTWLYTYNTFLTGVNQELLCKFVIYYIYIQVLRTWQQAKNSICYPDSRQLLPGETIFPRRLSALFKCTWTGLSSNFLLLPNCAWMLPKRRMVISRLRAWFQSRQMHPRNYFLIGVARVGSTKEEEEGFKNNCLNANCHSHALSEVLQGPYFLAMAMSCQHIKTW